MSDPLQGLFDRALEREARSEEQPSELTMDRWETDELSPPEREALEAIFSSPEVQARLDSRQQVEAELDAQMQAQIFDHVLAAHQAQDKVVPLFSKLGAFSRSKSMALLAVAASAAALFVVSLPQFQSITGIRTKGEQPRLVVYKERSGSVVRAEPQDAFYEGDRLRFEVDLKSAGHIMIIGVEASGARFSYFPMEKDARSQPMDEAAVVLPGAARLDNSKGWEWLHLITCDRPFTLTEIDLNASGQPMLPEGCFKSSFEMFKESR